VRALVYLGPRRMELQEVPEPVPAPGEARVRVSAAAICGSDLHGFREPSPRRIPPLVMGHEVVGVVDALGEDVASSLEGARVAAMPVVSCGVCPRCAEGRPNLCPERKLMGMDFPGGFAEAFTIPAGQLKPVPEALGDASGSLAEPFANAIHSVERAVRSGDDVLVIGAGPIGLFAARAAASAGARRTFVVDRVAARLALAADLGAEPLEAQDALGKLVAATQSRGVDAVIDAAGFPATWELALRAARWGGHVEAIGLGAPEGPISYHTLVSKGLTVVGSYACVEADFDRALASLASGEVDVAPWITTMRLDEGQRAFESLVDDGAMTKVVLLP
jgi:threonine dehydrogenase-like Zn-dependent dehydrogenase